MFGFGKKRKEKEMLKLKNEVCYRIINGYGTEADYNFLGMTPPWKMGLKSRHYRKYNVAIYWAPFDHNNGKIDEALLEQWKLENGVDYPHHFRSHEDEIFEHQEGVNCECEVFFLDAASLDYALQREHYWERECLAFFQDPNVMSRALLEHEVVWRAERGLRPLERGNPDDYLLDEDDI